MFHYKKIYALTRSGDRINPLSYAFESLLGNEFHGTIIPCAGNNIVPTGPGYEDTRFAACTGVGGAVQGATFVTGEQYLDSLSYSYSHMWRNVGIVWVWWVLFAGLTMFFTNRWLPASGGGVLLVPREYKEQSKLVTNDEESQTKEVVVDSSSTSVADGTRDNQPVENSLIKNTSVFTWKNLNYTVNTSSGPRLLLNNVQGWIKPGTLGALMG